MKEQIGAGPFSWEPYSHYLRKIQDGPLSASINYFKYKYDVVENTLAGSGVDTLTADGK